MFNKLHMCINSQIIIIVFEFDFDGYPSIVLKMTCETHLSDTNG